jgi:hypothetical protein
MRTRLLGAAAAAALTAGVGVASAAPAQAAGFYTIKSASVGKYLSYTAWTDFTSFKPTPGVTYRYCVVGSGSTTANLQPQAYGTLVGFNSSSLVTRCTKSWKTPSNYGSTMWLAGAKYTKSGSVYISKVYVQRYTTGPVPV